MSPRITPARPQDLDALQALEMAAFPSDRMSRRALAHAIQSPSLCFLVARARGSAQGDALQGQHLQGHALLAFRARSRIARLYSLAVAPSATRQGLGRALLEAAERKARARGAALLRLEVRADNHAAIKLYDQQGYARFARIPDYYEDGEAALRYEKRLP